jgi:hypothetical protein
MKVQYPIEGFPVEERVAAVLNCLIAGWRLLQSEPYGAHLLDPEYDQIFVVPREVMEFLIRLNIIEFKPAQ